MAVQSRVAVVTGGNKGIGLAIGNSHFRISTGCYILNKNSIVRNLALQYPSSPLRSGPFTVYLTARSAERGNEAVETLNNDSQLKEAKVLSRDGGDSTIKFKELDISNAESIHAFGDFLKKEHPEGIDSVVNNAGIALNGFSKREILNSPLFPESILTQRPRRRYRKRNPPHKLPRHALSIPNLPAAHPPRRPSRQHRIHDGTPPKVLFTHPTSLPFRLPNVHRRLQRLDAEIHGGRRGREGERGRVDERGVCGE
jgi:hypothetical protein